MIITLELLYKSAYSAITCNIHICPHIWIKQMSGGLDGTHVAFEINCPHCFLFQRPSSYVHPWDGCLLCVACQQVAVPRGLVAEHLSTRGDMILDQATAMCTYLYYI